MVSPVRRIIAGADGQGVSGLVADGPSPHVHTLPGMPADLALVDLWYTDGPGVDGSADPADRDLAVEPSPGGSLFRVVEFPPDTEMPTGDDGRPALFWHQTETVDYNVVLSGRLVLLTEDGSAEATFGDTLVVTGGRHAWSNPGTGPAVLAAVSVSDVRPG